MFLGFELLPFWVECYWGLGFRVFSIFGLHKDHLRSLLFTSRVGESLLLDRQIPKSLINP